MTLQTKGFQWSMGIHATLVLVFAGLQAFAVSQNKVMVIDFTFFEDHASPVVEQTSPYQAPAAKREPKRVTASLPEATPRKKDGEEKSLKEVAEKKNVHEAELERNAHRSAVEDAPAPAEVSRTREETTTAFPQAVEGSGGPSAEGKGRPIPSPQGADGVGAPSAKGASQDAAYRDGSTQGGKESPGNARTVLPAEVSRATYLKEHFVYIRDRITGSISYPHMARKMGWCGQVKIAFVVCEDGGVNDVRVVESSGFNLLDRNAVETVKNVAPFPCPPVKAEIRMAITYRLN